MSCWKLLQTYSAGGKYRCNWGFLHQGAWKNCWCVLGKSAPSQLTSYSRCWDRHSPLQESQLLSFLASDSTMLYEVYIFICKERLVIPESLHNLLILLLIGRCKNNSIEFWWWSLSLTKKGTNNKKSALGKQRRDSYFSFPQHELWQILCHPGTRVCIYKVKHRLDSHSLHWLPYLRGRFWVRAMKQK